MKVCENCGDEIATKDGDNHCPTCDNKKTKKAKAKRKSMDDAMRSIGMTKVRGALGGTYWE